MSSGILTIEIDGPMSGRENMQKDASRLETRLNMPILRFFQWAKPTISYGRLQTLEATARFARETEVEEIVQRPTGGGMVLHTDNDISISLAWMRNSNFMPNNTSNCISFIHGAITKGLKLSGIPSELADNEQKPGEKCFSWHIKNDIILADDSRKIGGGALRWTRTVVLYQGTIQAPSHFIKPKINGFITAVTTIFETSGRVAKLADALVSEASG